MKNSKCFLLLGICIKSEGPVGQSGQPGPCVCAFRLLVLEDEEREPGVVAVGRVWARQEQLRRRGVILALAKNRKMLGVADAVPEDAPDGCDDGHIMRDVVPTRLVAILVPRIVDREDSMNPRKHCSGVEKELPDDVRRNCDPSAELEHVDLVTPTWQKPVGVEVRDAGCVDPLVPAVGPRPGVLLAELLDKGSVVVENRHAEVKDLNTLEPAGAEFRSARREMNRIDEAGSDC